MFVRVAKRRLVPAAIVLAGAFALLPGCQRAAKQPNILIVVLDTVRRDAAGWPTAATPPELTRAVLTPNMAELAGRGVVWRNAWSAAPWTVPSHASLFTGLLPSGHGCNGLRPRLRSTLPTLADRLGEAGYETAAFFSNPWLADRSTWLLRGFQLRQEASIGGLTRMMVGEAAHDQGGVASVTSFRKWLSGRDPEKPFLAFVNILEAHLPYAPLPVDLAVAAPGLQAEGGIPIGLGHEYNSGLVDDAGVDWPRVRACYAGDVVAADRLFGLLLKALQEAGLDDETVVVVTSDHGENLGDHRLFEHQFSVHETLLAVPLVIAGPGIGPVGAVRAEPVMLTDLFATVLELAGLPAETAPPGSRSLFAAAAAADRPLVGEYEGPSTGLVSMLETINPQLDAARLRPARRTVRAGDLRLSWASDGSFTLHDMASDPEQARDLAPARPDDVRRLRVLLDVLAGAEPDAGPGGKLDEATRRQLESLGYVH
ncbi:MAG: sulfatase [bacterium]|nr:sulfatase [bacterium]